MNPAHDRLPLIHHFLSHQRLWSIGLLVTWAVVNVIVLSTSVLLEDGRDGLTLAIWEPFCWEITSMVMILILIPIVVVVSDKWLATLTVGKQILTHAALTVPVSALHVTGMVLLRELWYWWMSSDYQFGDIAYEFLYEYRKDFQSYVTIALVILGYRFIVRRLRGEASVIHEGNESHQQDATPERFLIKKLGKEFLVNVNDIEWVEAAGNYANLHVGSETYPLRSTMAKLETALPKKTFARIHRSTIVNLNHIQALTPLDTGDYTLTLLDGTSLGLSRRYREGFKELFNG